MMRIIKKRILLLFLGALACWGDAARSQERIALLIANADYPTQVGTLGAQPARDAQVIASALRVAGFKPSNVLIRRDLDRRAMRREIRAFARRLRKSGPDVVGFFYYAGHGAAAGIGESRGDYLLPAKAAITDPEQLLYDNEGVDVEALIRELRDSMTEAPKGALFVVLDACRNDLAPAFTKSGQRGFGAAPNAAGLLISYAAPAGAQTPNDGAFARILAEEIQKPNRSAIVAFAAAGQRVAQARGGGRGALPVLSPAISPEICFNGCAGSADGGAAAAALSRAKAAKTAAAYDAVVALYPNTEEAREAQRLRAALTAPAAAQQSGFEPALKAAGARGAQECKNCPTMTRIPAGEFMMGAQQGDPDQYANERPLRRVRIRPFAMARDEVTLGEFRRFAEATGRNMRACNAVSPDATTIKRLPAASYAEPGFEQGADHPAVCVSWDDAKAYIAWLNDQVAGAPYRLPSEAEFEYALRADHGAALYPWGAKPAQACRAANVGDLSAQRRFPKWSWVSRCSDGYVFTAPAAAFPANRWGLRNLSGNVFEWVEDCWNESHADAPTDGSARSDGACERRVLRGGSWGDERRVLRSAFRLGGQPSLRDGSVGFRLARTLGAR